MRFLLPLIAVLGGCASLDGAGVADYRVLPFVTSSGEVICCEVSVRNGKQMSSLDAVIVKDGEKYTVILQQRDVKAFKGQEVSAGVAQSLIDGAASILAKPLTGLK